MDQRNQVLTALAAASEDVHSSSDMDALTEQLLKTYELVPTWRGTIDLLATLRDFSPPAASSFVTEGTKALMLFDWLSASEVKDLLSYLHLINDRETPTSATDAAMAHLILLAVALLRRFAYLLDLSVVETVALLGAN